MAKQQLVILSVALLVVILFVMSRCTLSCKKPTEGFTPSLSEDGPMKRSPVDTAFRGDGISGNPSYKADPTDELVPLEHGGVDFYKDDRHEMAGTLFAPMGECYRGHETGIDHLINDDKTRADLADSGETGWYRLLTNMPNASHAISPAAGHVEADYATATPASYSQGLYSPSYHRDHVGN